MRNVLPKYSVFPYIPNLKNAILVVFLGLLAIAGGARGSAIPPGDPASSGSPAPSGKPIVILVADKMDSLELFGSRRPAIQRLLAGSACGLMSIRSGGGYSNSGSGYLSLGAGGRSVVNPTCKGAYDPAELLFGSKLAAGHYLDWSLPRRGNSARLIIPEMGMLLEQAKINQFSSTPGLLGTIFRGNGWSTSLLGNLDTADQIFRPGGFIVADQNGLIGDGDVAPALNRKDPLFPAQASLDVRKTITELIPRLEPRRLMVIDFGDFYRLDYYQEQIPARRFPGLKGRAWLNFSRLVDRLTALAKTKPFSLVLVVPSVSKEGRYRGNLLTPLVVRDQQYPPGLLTSGTTKWLGLVANNDFVPTLVHLGALDAKTRFSGRIMVSRPTSGQIPQILALNQRLVKFYGAQRPLLNWYMAIITLGWIGGLVALALRRKLGNYLFTVVMAVPLTLILLPLLPETLWKVPVFVLAALGLGWLFRKIPDLTTRILLLSGIIWGVLVIDQACGWRLIRYSALGYSAVDGSRYYGMGNEYMGIFLATSLILAHLIHTKTQRKWPVWLIFGMALGVLSMPQLGAKFGGILSGTVGFLYYLIRLHKVKLANRKFWIALGLFCLMLVSIGWWDSVRPPEVQTHIGRFLRLLWTKDFDQVTQIIFRKINMNLKLTVASPWMRITWLALGIGICHRLIRKVSLTDTGDRGLVWKSILVTGVAAYLVNDAGVLALATCLAFGFTYILLQTNDQVCAGWMSSNMMPSGSSK